MNPAQDCVSVLLGTGSGGFGPATNFPVGHAAYSIAEGDFKHDGNLDLVVAARDFNCVSMLLGNGSGGFGPARDFPVQDPWGLAVGDFNLDGNLDVAVTNAWENTVSVLIGNGGGSLGYPNTYTTGSFPTKVAVGDFNHDGSPDLAVMNNMGGTVSVLLGDGTGNFGTASSYQVGSFLLSIAVGDFNHDGNPDLAVVDEGESSVSVLLGNGTGGFGSKTSFPAGLMPAWVATGDFNHDGNLDLAVTDEAKNDVNVLLGNGSGSFAPAGTVACGANPVAVAAGDFNAYGASDLAVADDNNPASFVSVLPNQSPDTTVAVTSNSYQNTGRAGQLVTFTATVSQAYSPLPFSPTGLVTFQDGTTVLGTGTLDSNGTATLSTFALASGYHAITATYQGVPHFAGSTSPVLNQLVDQDGTGTVLSSSANPAVVGQPFTLTATVWPDPSGFGPPTGNVVFQILSEENDGTGPPRTIGVAPLQNGAASLTVAFPWFNQMQLQAVYVGDDNFTGSTSLPLAEVINNPAPLLKSLRPNAVNEGNASLTLTLAGSDFLSSSSVLWNGSPLGITFLSSTQIQATVPAALVAEEGTATITVTNPGPGGGSSLAQTFTIADAPLTASGRNISVIGKKNFSGPVATFTDGNAAALLGDFSAIINWDDGSASYGTVTSNGAGLFTVAGSHAFRSFNNVHTITVTIFDVGGSIAKVTDNVIDPPSKGGHVKPVHQRLPEGPRI